MGPVERFREAVERARAEAVAGWDGSIGVGVILDTPQTSTSLWGPGRLRRSRATRDFGPYLEETPAAAVARASGPRIEDLD
jgi:hypothetical protein